MFIDLKQLDTLKVAFTDLGKAVSDLSSNSDEYYLALFHSAEKVSRLIDEAVPAQGISKSVQFTDQVGKKADEISKMVDGIYGGSSSDFKTVNESVDKLGNKFTDLSKKVSEMQRKARADSAKRSSTKSSSSSKNKQKSAGIVRQELQAVAGRFAGFWSSLKLPVFGSMAAGAIGLAMYGFSESQRLKAEAGEVSDILVNSVDGHHKKLKDKMTGWVSGYQEKLQKFYGVERGEIQNTVRTFSEAGIAMEEWSKGTDKSLGMVGQNFASFALGVDKLFNVAGGTTAARMVDYAEKYGESLESSKSALLNIGELALGSGLGSEMFLKHVESSAEAMSKLGFSLEATAGVMAKMQERFENLQIPKHLSAKLISTGMQSVASGISGVSDGWKALVAEWAGFGKGIDALQKFKEYWTRLNSDTDNTEELMNFVSMIVDNFMKMFENNEAQTKRALQEVFGWNTEGVVSAFEMNKAVKSGDIKAAKKEAVTFSKGVKQSMVTEAQKRTVWERAMNRWMKGMSKIGMGLLALMGNALARLILYFRSIPSLLANLFDREHGAEKNRELMAYIGTISGGWDKGLELTVAGIKEVAKGGGEMFRAVGDAADNVYNAITSGKSFFNPYDGATTPRENARTQVATIGNDAFQNVGRLNSNQVGESATIDTSKMNVSGGEVLDDAQKGRAGSAVGEELMTPGGSRFQGPTMGMRAQATPTQYDRKLKKLEIVNFGTDELGWIKVGLRGQCPRCGLEFGKKLDAKDMPKNSKGFELRSAESDVSKNYSAEKLAAMDDLTLQNQDTLDKMKDQKERDAYIAALMMTREGAHNKTERANLLQSLFNRKRLGIGGYKTFEGAITANKGLGVQGNNGRAYSTYGVDTKSDEFKKNYEASKKAVSTGKAEGSTIGNSAYQYIDQKKGEALPMRNKKGDIPFYRQPNQANVAVEDRGNTVRRWFDLRSSDAVDVANDAAMDKGIFDQSVAKPKSADGPVYEY